MKQTVEWKVGMRVAVTLYGIGGYTEKTEGTITKINKKTKTIYVDDNNGVTFGFDGKEKENFFPPIRQEICPERSVK